MQTFENLAALAGCGELLWAGHFHTMLSLGGHMLDMRKFTIDGYLPSHNPAPLDI